MRILVIIVYRHHKLNLQGRISLQKQEYFQQSVQMPNN